MQKTPNERTDRLHFFFHPNFRFEILLTIYPPLRPISDEYFSESLLQTRTFTSLGKSSVFESLKREKLS